MHAPTPPCNSSDVGGKGANAISAKINYLPKSRGRVCLRFKEVKNGKVGTSLSDTRGINFTQHSLPPHSYLQLELLESKL